MPMLMLMMMSYKTIIRGANKGSHLTQLGLLVISVQDHTSLIELAVSLLMRLILFIRAISRPFKALNGIEF